MPITNIQTNAQWTDTTNPIECTIVVSDGAGNNRKVVVAILEDRNPPQTTAPTISGVSGRFIGAGAGAATTRVGFYEWFDADLPTTSGTYTVSWPVTSAQNALAVISCSQAKQIQCACPIGSGGTSTLTWTQTLVTSADSISLIGFLDASGTASLTTGAGQTDILGPIATGGGGATVACSYKTSNSTVSYSRPASGTWAGAVCAIEPYQAAPTAWLRI
jgi:hypothetical protein